MSTTTLTSQRVRLTTGVELDYHEQGDPSGTLIVLLHGLSDSWQSFQPLLQQLPTNFHAFAVSQRGHGDSERPAAGYDPASLAADAAAFLDALGMESAVIVGHSMGAHVAQRFAIDYPQRTAALVLIGAFAPLRGTDDAAEFDPMFQAIADPVSPEFVREFQESCIAMPVEDGLIDAVVSESLKLPARVWHEVWDGLRDADFSDEFATITAPTLVTWGDLDAFCTRTMQDHLVASILGARLSVYRGAGHTPHWEQPARFAVDLAAFVADTSLQDASA